MTFYWYTPILLSLDADYVRGAGGQDVNGDMTIKPGLLYEHKRTAVIYQVRDVVRIKINGEWADGVLYGRLLSSRKFVRTTSDFAKSFVEYHA